MNIKALRAFRHAYSEGSLIAASHRMNLSQPAVSRLVSGLESELKLTLFSRDGRALTPTAEGVAFYREAGRILDNLDEVPRIAEEIRAGRTDSLRVVTMPRLAVHITTPVIAKFTQAHPQIRINLDLRTRRDAGKWLGGRAYDIGIGGLPIDNPDIDTSAFMRVRALAVLPRGHSLGDKDRVSADDLRNENFIKLMQGTVLRDQIDQMFQAAGIVVPSSVEVVSSQLACSLVAHGGGVTVADEMMAAPYRDAVQTVPIEPARWTTFGFLFSRRTGKSDAAALLEDAIRSHVKTLAATSSTMEYLGD